MLKDYFSWLLSDTWKKTDELFSWQEEVRDVNFKHKNIGEGNKKIVINSNGWCSLNRDACLRFARFQSEVFDIATIMIYPISNPDQFPVFAAEWVAVQNKIHVIVLDIECLDKIDSIPKKRLDDLHRKWVSVFPEVDEKPDWFNEISSEWAIFSKSSVDNQSLLRKMFNEYLSLVYQSFYTRNKFDTYCSKGDHENVLAYKRHHDNNSPARKIIRPEHTLWLNEFLTENHFKAIKQCI